MKRFAVVPDIVAGVTMFGFVILSEVRSTKSKDLVK